MPEAKNQRAEEQEQAEQRDREGAELERARAVLERTVQFLSRCKDDPLGALRDQDPGELIQGLKSLSISAPAPENEIEAADEPRTIQIRRRRSA